MRIYKGLSEYYEDVPEHHNDVVVYAPTKEDYMTDLDKAGLLDKEFKKHPLVTATPMVSNKDKEVMTLVRLTDEQLSKFNKMKKVKVLGTYDEVESNPRKKAIHDRIYDSTEKTMIDPDTHEVYTHKPPKRFGSFA